MKQLFRFAAIASVIAIAILGFSSVRARVYNPTVLTTSTVAAALPNPLTVTGSATSTITGDGTTSTIGGPLFSTGGFFDASSTRIVPTYTYSVCPQVGECDYTTLQAALAQASTTQAATAIYVHGGTYTVPAGGYKVCSDRLIIRGDGQATVFNFNLAGSNNAFSMCDATQRSFITMQDFYLHNIGSVASTTGIDFDHFALSTFERLRVASFYTSYYASSTGSIYNKFLDNTNSVSGGYGYFIGNVVNDTTIQGERTLINSASSTCIGIYGNGTHAINLISDNCEFGAQVAIDIGNGTHDITISNYYSEQNAIGFQIASGTYAVSVVGGYFGNATTTAGQSGPEEINNLGGIFCFYNVNVNYANFSHCETAANTPDYRWLIPYMNAEVTTNATSSASSTVYVQELNVPMSENVCGIAFVTGAATDTGIFSTGIYGPIITLDTVNGAPLAVQATNTLAAAAINSSFIITVPTTTLRGGNYYVALQLATTTNYLRNNNQTQVVGWTQTITNSTTTNLLPAISPAPVNTPSLFPALHVQTCSLTNTL